MESKMKSTMMTYLLIGGAYVSFCVGASFSTGNELMQYFASYGVLGIVGAIIATALCLLLIMVLIRDAIGRVGQDQRHEAIRDMRHQLHTVRAVNLIAQVKKCCVLSVLHALKPLQTWSSSACKAPYCVETY